MDLFGGSPEPEASGSGTLNINEGYASRFQHNHERAELHRLQEKYGAAAADILAGNRVARDDDDDEDEDDSSDNETEDEEGEQVTAEVDAAILRTLAKIRSGDASIYDSEKRVFDEEKALAAASALLPKATREKVGKKVTLADYQRERMRDLMKTAEDPAAALAEATTSRTRQDEMDDEDQEGQQPLSHVQEQEALRKQVTQAFHTIGDDEESEAADGFFTRRDEDNEEDPEAYRKYLLANLGSKKAQQAVREALRYEAAGSSPAAGPSSSAAEQETEPSTAAADTSIKKEKKQRKSAKSEAQSNEDFLMNYILNRGWMDKPHAAPKLTRRPARPQESEDENGQPSTAAKATVNGDAPRDWDAEAAQLLSDDDEEDDFDNRAEAFEQAFNFRYEALEAGAAPAQVTSYARGKDAQQNSVRRVEDKRKKEREERKARKEAEKLAKRQELDRMRDLQRKGLREKLKQLREAAGSHRIDFDPDKLEGDFDPEAHDRMMAVFGDAYYDEEGDDGVDMGEGGKPTWADDIDIDDILADEEKEEAEATASGKKTKGKKSKKGDLDMDADFLDGADGEVDDEAADDGKLSKKERKKLKKKAKRAEKTGATTTVDPIASSSTGPVEPLPQTDAERKAAAARLVEQYRDLDYEDVIGGDLPTRFHYTTVPKTNYGMSAVEILLADDKDLNDVVGLKQMQPYRRGAERMEGKRSKELNRRLKEFRRKLDRGEEDAGAAALEGRVRDSGYKKRKADGADGGERPPAKKRMGKKERAKAAKAAAEADAVEQKAVKLEQPNRNGEENEESKEDKRRRKEEKKARKQAKAEAEGAEAPQAKKQKVA
ncbi:Krr1-domain-containing protein [Jaminaea rosea]|uniref:Krr1-domain-containing protein n=1 Tax=Jaminaea rosea TaxID=1569628 RepID=A0A316UYH2_9BASI|nr:Krr1-domain-containing protein [Jaminaea rosea]PWN28953.1 Krr1-domain-containing protein [Jaminaea rosea]